MSMNSHENLKTIRFEGELLPNWAQLLDLAAMLCPASEDTRRWFSRLTNSCGVDDSRNVMDHCGSLKISIRDHREVISNELKRNRDDAQPTQVLAAWIYALDTMIQQAGSRKACSWVVEGVADTEIGDSGGSDITLRRV